MYSVCGLLRQSPEFHFPTLVQEVLTPTCQSILSYTSWKVCITTLSTTTTITVWTPDEDMVSISSLQWKVQALVESEMPWSCCGDALGFCTNASHLGPLCNNEPACCLLQTADYPHKCLGVRWVLVSAAGGLRTRRFISIPVLCSLWETTAALSCVTGRAPISAHVGLVMAGEARWEPFNSVLFLYLCVCVSAPQLVEFTHWLMVAARGVGFSLM